MRPTYVCVGCRANPPEIKYYGALHFWVTVYFVTILCRSAATKISAALQLLLLMLKGAASRKSLPRTSSNRSAAKYYGPIVRIVIVA